MSRDREVDNPAGRLHDLLGKFQGVAAGQTMSCAAAWSKVLGLESTDPEYLACLGKVAVLYPQTLLELEEAGHADHAANVRTFVVAINKPLQIGDTFFVQHDSARQAVDDRAQTVLNFAATLLSTQRSQGRVPTPAELGDILSAVVSLMDDIESSQDFSPTVKDLLLRRLLEVQRAVNEIRFRGPAGLREAGELLLVGSATAAANSQPAAKPFIDRLNQVVATVTAVCALTMTVQTTVLDTAANIPKVIAAVQSVQGELEGPPPVHQLDAGGDVDPG